MREVSCKVLGPFLRAADRRGIPRHELTRGLAYSRRHLEDRHERIDYEAFEQVMANVRRWFSDDDIVAIGAEGVGSPLVRSFITIGRTLMTPVGFYRWMLSAGGLGNQMFTNVVPTFRETEPGHFVVELRTAAGYRPNREFLLMSRGGMEAVSRLLGLGRQARVELTLIEAGGRFDIRVPVEQSRRARLVRLLSLPLSARTAAAELEDAMRALEQRYAELETARAAVERQRRLLDLDYRLGHALWGERDAAVIAELTVRQIVEVAGQAAARVDVALDGAPAVGAAWGTGDGAPATVELTGHRIAGTLQVWPPASGDPDETRQLIELLAPTVALALDNAAAYHALQAYQRDLERLVDARTAELRTARDELARTVEQLRAAQDAREKIFANISHEIRTPLSLILLAVADVEARAAAQLDDRARADLTAVVDSARKLLRLVDELLLLAAGRETALRVAPQSTDLARLLAAVVATWRPAAEAAGLTLHVRLPDELTVMADPVAIERIVTNLLSNAVKFTPAGGRVAVELRDDRDAVVIAVRDTGIGIDDDLRQRLFGRFERGRGAPNGRGGSGIGLSLVKELAEAHGGAVAVERVAAGGTEFRVTLPAVAPAPDAPAPEDATPPRLRPSDFGLGGAVVASGDVLEPATGRAAATVLVAEDDPRLAGMIARLLAEDHRVVIALDGLAAADLAGRHQPALLVTDVQMPGMDGVALTRRFREIVGNRLAPVVILSAAADLGTRLAGLDAGAIDFVIKPFDPRELRARVRGQLAMRDLALRLHRAEQLASLGTLSSGLAHELRNPANAIVNAVQPLRKLLPEDLRRPEAATGQLLDVLGGCAEQIALLSRQLLSFRRGGELELRVVPLREVCERAAVLVQPALKDVALRVDVPPDLLVRCAPPLLAQVLSNLVENGGHAAAAAAGDGWVELCARGTGATVTIEVADSGGGVPPDLRERVFEPFFTTKPPGVGTGLGLPLARDLVHRHGGVIEIRDRGGRAVFAIDLPSAAADAGAEPVVLAREVRA